MSLCRTCEYALYDGMCMAHGKFTLLDATACDDYKMHLDVEVSHLKSENAKLRTALSAVLQCSGIMKRDKGCDACPMYNKEKEYVWAGDWCGIKRFIRELGVEVDA